MPKITNPITAAKAKGRNFTDVITQFCALPIFIEYPQVSVKYKETQMAMTIMIVQSAEVPNPEYGIPLLI